MTKKEFNELSDYHRYIGNNKENSMNALFWGWREVEVGGVKYRGFSHCAYSRAPNATKKELEKSLYNFIGGKTDKIDCYIQLVAIKNDKQRFRVPINGRGLYLLPNQ